jgi:hypothetical protein
MITILYKTGRLWVRISSSKYILGIDWYHLVSSIPKISSTIQDKYHYGIIKIRY